MFTTPKKQKQQISQMEAKENNPHHQQQHPHKPLTNTPKPTTSKTTPTTTTTIVFENGTMFGAIANDTKTTTATATSKAAAAAKLSGTTTYLTIPEIVISASSSSNSLNQSRCEISQANSEESAVESTALLEATTPSSTENMDLNMDDPAEEILQDEFDEFILNRTISESNILESSIYSELQFPPSLHGGSTIADINNINSTGNSSSGGGGGGGYLSSSGGPTATIQVAGPQTPPNGRQTKRTKRKHKTKSKCTATAATLAAAAAQRASPTHYPPRYTAIFMDPNPNQFGTMMTATGQQHHLHNGSAANALGQIASAAASSPFLNQPVVGAADTAAYMQQFQYFQQRPMVTTMGTHTRRHHRSLFEASTAATTVGIENPLNVLTTTAAPVVPAGGITPPLRLSFRKWFSRPSLPFVIGILALGGVACTLGGIVLGSTGLIEHSTQYLSAALLMIGIGVSLLVISGAIWRLSLPDDIDECPCYRHMEMCRNCNSPYCNSRLMGGNYLYPEFQHRPPPPSYLTSLNECTGMSLLFHPTASTQQAAYSTLRVNTPPPLYRSTNSLSVFGPNMSQHPNAAAVPTIVPTTTTTSSRGLMPDHNVITMSTVMENIQAQTQPLIKEFNYLELD